LRTGFGLGLLLCVLIPLALLLFSVVSLEQTASLMLLLGGLWAVVFGVAFAAAKDKLYDVGVGVIVAVLSTFSVLPLQYTAGLVVVSIIGVVVFSMMGRSKPPQQRMR